MDKREGVGAIAEGMRCIRHLRTGGKTGLKLDDDDEQKKT